MLLIVMRLNPPSRSVLSFKLIILKCFYTILLEYSSSILASCLRQIYLAGLVSRVPYINVLIQSMRCHIKIISLVFNDPGLSVLIRKASIYWDTTQMVPPNVAYKIITSIVCFLLASWCCCSALSNLSFLLFCYFNDPSNSSHHGSAVIQDLYTVHICTVIGYSTSLLHLVVLKELLERDFGTSLQIISSIR